MSTATIRVGRLISIQVGTPTWYGLDGADSSQPSDKPWRTSFFKRPVAGKVAVGPTSLTGDEQADSENHGGVDKAVLAYSADHYPFWRSELSIADIPWGAFGENLSIANLDESLVCIGDQWRIGAAMFEVSQPRQPCWKLARRWQIKDLAARVVANGRSGWYLRVLQTGEIEAGQSVELVARPNPLWTIARAHQVMHHQKNDLALSAELAALPELSAAWKSELGKR